MAGGAGAAGRPIFIVGFPRSGTTLVQRLLNACRDTLILGEHAGLLAGWAAAWERARQLQAGGKLGQGLARGDRGLYRWLPWLNPWTEEELRAIFRRFVEDLFCHAPNWGFKEVRYGGYDGGRTVPALVDLFPEARWVVVVRDPLATLTSVIARFHAGDERHVVPRSRAWARTYRHLRRELADRALVVRYEELDVAAITALVGQSPGEVHRRVLSARGGAAPAGSPSPAARRAVWEEVKAEAIEWGYKEG